MRRFLLVVALAAATASPAYAAHEPCVGGICVDPCVECVAPRPDPCDVVRCTPSCVLGVSCR